MQKGSALILLTVVAALIIVITAGAYYYFSIKDSTKSLQTPQPVVQLPIIKDESIKPSNKIYSNKDLDLELKTPANYSIKEETEEEYFKRANGDIRENFTYYVQYPPADFAGSFYVLPDGETNLDNAALSVVAFENPDKLTPTEFYKKYWYYPFIWGEFGSSDKEKISPKSIELIAGREAGTAIADFREAKPKFIYLPYGNKGLMLQIHLPSDNQEAETILKSLVLN